MQNQVQTTAGLAFSLSDLLCRVENDHELVRDLLVIFKQDYPGHLLTLEAAVLRLEMKQVQATSHTLKGMLSNLAMARAADAAANLEQMGRKGERAGLKEALEHFEQEIAGVMPMVDSYLLGACR